LSDVLDLAFRVPFKCRSNHHWTDNNSLSGESDFTSHCRTEYRKLKSSHEWGRTL